MKFVVLTHLSIWPPTRLNANLSNLVVMDSPVTPVPSYLAGILAAVVQRSYCLLSKACVVEMFNPALFVSSLVTYYLFNSLQRRKVEARSASR